MSPRRKTSRLLVRSCEVLLYSNSLFSTEEVHIDMVLQLSSTFEVFSLSLTVVGEEGAGTGAAFFFFLTAVFSGAVALWAALPVWNVNGWGIVYCRLGRSYTCVLSWVNIEDINSTLMIISTGLSACLHEWRRLCAPILPDPSSFV